MAFARGRTRDLLPAPPHHPVCGAFAAADGFRPMILRQARAQRVRILRPPNEEGRASRAPQHLRLPIPPVDRLERGGVRGVGEANSKRLALLFLSPQSSKNAESREWTDAHDSSVVSRAAGAQASTSANVHGGAEALKLRISRQSQWFRILHLSCGYCDCMSECS